MFQCGNEPDVCCHTFIDLLNQDRQGELSLWSYTHFIFITGITGFSRNKSDISQKVQFQQDFEEGCHVTTYIMPSVIAKRGFQLHLYCTDIPE